MKNNSSCMMQVFSVETFAKRVFWFFGTRYPTSRKHEYCTTALTQVRPENSS